MSENRHINMLRIKEILKTKNITVSQLAEKLGIEQSNLSNIINEKRGTSLPMLENIASILDVPMASLFYDYRESPSIHCPNCGEEININVSLKT